ncbi:hypothetical protein DRP05_11015 [Archaeoglobales archaeon]|nr:MAG: hypothetical protein DRP05_11015 [Archaeoglobales archaeon]
MFKIMDNKVYGIPKATILKKLKRRGKWGGAHTSLNKLTSGIPKHLRGKAKDITKDLIREGLLLSKPTSYGLEVSLNPKRRKEIDEIIHEYLSKE